MWYLFLLLQLLWRLCAEAISISPHRKIHTIPESDAKAKRKKIWSSAECWNAAESIDPWQNDEWQGPHFVTLPQEKGTEQAYRFHPWWDPPPEWYRKLLCLGWTWILMLTFHTDTSGWGMINTINILGNHRFPFALGSHHFAEIAVWWDLWMMHLWTIFPPAFYKEQQSFLNDTAMLYCWGWGSTAWTNYLITYLLRTEPKATTHFFDLRDPLLCMLKAFEVCASWKGMDKFNCRIVAIVAEVDPDMKAWVIFPCPKNFSDDVLQAI